jgi:hypothetical protein
MLVIVDAENVRRSIWPNVSREELVELLAGWKDASGDAPLVVFDGGAPDAVPGVNAVGSGAETADELRERAGARAERIVGGGSFVRELTGADANADEPRQRGDGT